VKEASVFTLLVGGLRISDIEGPLSHFQHTIFEKEDFFKLVKSINESQAQSKQDESRLRRIFDKFWDELEANVSKAIKPDAKPEKKRSAEDMLRELLDVTSYIARNVRNSDGRAVSEDSINLPIVTGGELWKTILEKVGKISPFARTYLLEAQGGRLADGTFVIYFNREFQDIASLVNNAKNVAMLQKILSDLGCGENCKVEFRVWPPPVPPSTKRQ
jgi:hypothetical protein